MRSGAATRWAAVLAVAERQRGVIIRPQLRAAGVSWKVECQLVSDGWLRPVGDAGYAIAGRPPSTWEHAVAIGLRGGPGSALSHSTAAGIHRFAGVAVTREPEIIIPSPHHPRLPGARVHRVAALSACDVEQRSGVGVTTPSRTVVDLAGRLGAPLLERIVDEGSIARLWTFDELAACAARLGGQGRAGSRVLRSLLAERVDEPGADSGLEMRMIRVLAPFAPFETQYQLVLEGEVFILDIAWPCWKVGAEVDGWRDRSRSRSKLDQDSHKINVLTAYHWQVAHLTSTMSDAAVLRDVGRLLPVGAASLRSGRRRR